MAPPAPTPWGIAALLATVVSTLTVAVAVFHHFRAVRSRDARRIRRSELAFPLPVVAAAPAGLAAGILLTDRHAELDWSTAQNLLMPLLAGAAADTLLRGKRHGRATAVVLTLLVATARGAVS
ncbi:hypothetical protein LG634_09515 [Streptomyces bambusae]|uniref:hypothetical protein n=1 Tax=Streptomyces bambusae TaxID=1550616 RepID=UPI001CFEBCA7|nr:hypothetical protein [Streptomyces bambusae]MCB5165065.1 hypothetical protein [Streptomyces bambusae]